MDHSDEIADRYARFESAKERGQDLSPEQLCVDRSDLLQSLKAAIAALQNFPKVPADPTADELGLPPVLSDFDVEGPLGHGGMGQVWLVRGKYTGEPFALKQVRESRDHLRRALIEELQTWKSLPAHPNLTSCRFFRWVGNYIAIFAEYVDGGSLADRIRSGRVTKPHDIMDAAIQSAWGLHVLHERGLVHQDIKPSNMLVTVDGTVKLTDFGTAKGMVISPSVIAGDFVGESVVVSQGGMTRAYCSPEQAAGQRLTRKTDVWSWAVSVMEMFLGKIPCCEHGGEYAGIVLDRIGDKMPPSVIKLLRQCFDSEISRRPTAGEVAEKLCEIYRGVYSADYARSLISLPLSADVTGGEIHDRRSVHGVKWDDPRPMLDVVRDRMGGSQVYDGLSLPSASRELQAIGDLSCYIELCQNAEMFVAAGTKELLPYLANFYNNRGHVHVALADNNGALFSYERAAAICDRLVKEVKSVPLLDALAGAHLHKGNALHLLGRNDEAQGEYDLAIATADQLIKAGWKALLDDLAMAHANKGISLQDLGRVDEAIAEYGRAIGIRDQLVRSGRSDILCELATSRMNKGCALHIVGQDSDAIAEYDLALGIRAQLVEAGKTELLDDLATVHVNKGVSLCTLGCVEEAIREYDRALIIRDRLVKSGRTDWLHGLAVTHINKGNALLDLGRFDNAVGEYNLAISTFNKLLSDGRTELLNELAGAHMNKGNALLMLGRIDDALDAYNWTIKIRDQMVKAGRQELLCYLASARMNKAVALGELGRSSEAIQELDQCIDIYSQLVNKKGRSEFTADLAKATIVRVVQLADMGMIELARAEARQAVAALKTEATRNERPELLVVLQYARANLGHLL